MYIILDNQWIDIMPALLKELSRIGGRCKLWLICPFEMQDLISNDVYPFVSCVNDLLEEKEM